jgi:hypothetical protein
VRSGGQLQEVARAVAGLARDEASFVGGGFSDAMGRNWRAGIARATSLRDATRYLTAHVRYSSLPGSGPTRECRCNRGCKRATGNVAESLSRRVASLNVRGNCGLAVRPSVTVGCASPSPLAGHRSPVAGRRSPNAERRTPADRKRR